MSFGWSVGDLIAAIQFVARIASALDDVSGAAKDLRDSAAFLHDLGGTLTALQTISALSSGSGGTQQATYRNEIARLVTSVRPAVDDFIKEVAPLEKELGAVPRDGPFRHLQNIQTKLKWHFSLSKRALKLQAHVGRYLQIINTLMQRLTVDILHDIQHPQRGVAAGVATDVRTLLDARLPEHQESLLTELGARDARNREADRDALRALLEDLLENYLGPQRLALTPNGASGSSGGYFSQQATLVGEPEGISGGDSGLAVKELVDGYAPALKEMHDAGVAHVVGDKSWLAEAKPVPRAAAAAAAAAEDDAERSSVAPTCTGLSADWAITQALQGWWSRRGSETMWISAMDRAADGDGDCSEAGRRLAAEVVSLAGGAACSRSGAVAAYRFERVDAEGRIASPREHLVRFVYSLLYQVGSTMVQVHEAPSSAAVGGAKNHAAGAGVSMDATRFICLNGRYESLDNALELLRDMLRLKPGRLLVVIDGLDALDFSADASLDEHVAALLGLLEDKTLAAEVKTLFVTGEHSQLLSAAVAPQNTIDASLLGGSEGFLDRETFEMALTLDP